MSKKIKVLMVENVLSINGISAVIFNYINHIDKNKFSVAVMGGGPIAEKYKNRFNELNVEVVELPPRNNGKKNYYKSMQEEMGRREFDIVHVHGSNASITPEILIAKKCGTPVRIAHCHSTAAANKAAHYILKPVLQHVATDFFACGQEAGKWLFDNKPFYLMKNGFDTDKFKFSEEIRERVRAELNLTNEHLIGHVGGLNPIKNQLFLIEVFEEIAQRDTMARLILIGAGPDEEAIKSRIKKSKYDSQIILYGETDDSESLYMAMDLFVFPSKAEGLGMALIEAQITGLPCIISDKIPSEACLTDNIHKMSLQDSAHKWADLCISMLSDNHDRESCYYNNQTAIEEYNINNCVRALEKKYLEIVQR